MLHKRTISFLVLGALAVTMAFGAVAYRSVFAATPSTTTTETTTSTATTELPLSSLPNRPGPMGGYTQEGLATALGITTDELAAAYETAYTAALQDAVSQGLITQAQADELSANGNVFPFGKRWDGWLAKNGIDFETYLAEALDISVDELKAAYQTAYYANIDQAVAYGNLSQDQADLMKSRYALYNDSTFQSSMQSAYTEAVNQAVSTGVISQSQADQILSNSNNMFKAGEAGWGGRGGGPRGHGGEGMNAGFLPPAP